MHEQLHIGEKRENIWREVNSKPVTDRNDRCYGGNAGAGKEKKGKARNSQRPPPPPQSVTILQRLGNTAENISFYGRKLGTFYGWKLGMFYDAEIKDE